MRTDTLKISLLSLLFLFSSLSVKSQCTATISGGGALCPDGSITLPISFEGGGEWTFIYAKDGIDQPAITTSENPYPLVVDGTGLYVLTSATSSVCGTGILNGSSLITDDPPLDVGGICISPGCYNEQTEMTACWGNTGTPPMTFEWSNGFTGQTQNVDPYISFTVTITDSNGCTDTGTAQGYEAVVNCELTQSAPLLCAGNTISLTTNCFSQGGVPILTYLWSTGETTTGIEVTQPGTYSLTVANAAGCDTVLTRVIEAAADCGEIQGKVVKDENLDCEVDSDDTNLANWTIRATSSTHEFFGFSDENGEYAVNVIPGDYDIEVIPFNPDYWDFCENNVPITIEDPSDIEEFDFIGQATVDCPALEVDIATWAFRRCFETPTTVTYANMGTQLAEDAYIEITVDPELEIISADIPFTGPIDNVYTFEIGDVGIGESGSFSCSVFTSCNSILGQALCYEAHIFPDTLCSVPAPSWSGASLELSSTCNGDSLFFTITNIGEDDMDEALEWVIIQDGVMMLEVTDGPPLTVDESFTVSVPANGATYVFEVPQVEGHPGFSSPLLTIEGCGVNSSGEFSTGFLLQYPQDDEDYFKSIFCAVVQGSYDPNDKQGFPIGYGPQHFIEPGQELDYLIRFQNTGTDTAFNVRIDDVISDKLDLSTFRPGASSHAYEVEFRSDTVVFLFPNIMLPDSNVNEPLSHGFVKFKINQKPDNEIGDIIENTADIYFDFNEAIITNTTVHELGEEFIIASIDQTTIPNLQILAQPNPTSGETTFRLLGDLPHGKIDLSLFDMTGRQVGTHSFYSSSLNINLGDLPDGLYFFQIKMEGGAIGTGKILKQ